MVIWIIQVFADSFLSSNVHFLLSFIKIVSFHQSHAIRDISPCIKRTGSVCRGCMTRRCGPWPITNVFFPNFCFPKPSNFVSICWHKLGTIISLSDVVCKYYSRYSVGLNFAIVKIKCFKKRSFQK